MDARPPGTVGGARKRDVTCAVATSTGRERLEAELSGSERQGRHSLARGGRSPRLALLLSLGVLAAWAASLQLPTAHAATGLVAGYGFPEGTGTTTADASGGRHHWHAGRPGLGRGQERNGPVLQRLVHVRRPRQSAALGFTGSMTLSAWVYETANVGDDGQIVAKSDGGSGWQLKSTPDTGPRTFGIAITNTSGGDIQRYSSTVRALNTWYHVAGVYDATARTLNIYVNGVLNNGVLSGTVPTAQRASTSPPTSVAGRGDSTFKASSMTSGSTAERSALAEIQADMAAPVGGVAGDTTPPSAPTNLTATAASSSQINLSWTASTDNVGGDRVPRLPQRGSGRYQLPRPATPTPASCLRPPIPTRWPPTTASGNASAAVHGGVGDHAAGGLRLLRSPAEAPCSGSRRRIGRQPPSRPH